MRIEPRRPGHPASSDAGSRHARGSASEAVAPTAADVGAPGPTPVVGAGSRVPHPATVAARVARSAEAEGAFARRTPPILSDARLALRDRTPEEREFVAREVEVGDELEEGKRVDPRPRRIPCPRLEAVAKEVEEKRDARRAEGARDRIGFERAPRTARLGPRLRRFARVEVPGLGCVA